MENGIIIDGTAYEPTRVTDDDGVCEGCELEERCQLSNYPICTGVFSYDIVRGKVFKEVKEW